MADQQGTGKHPHKSAEDPRPHHEAQEKHKGGSQSGGSQTGQHQQEHSGGRQHQSGSESSDLKEREYRDKEGNIHHHTHTSSEKK